MVSTLSARSAAARSVIGSSKWVTATMPTPKVPPSASRFPPEVTKVGFAWLPGVTVEKVLVFSLRTPCHRRR
jgi:hypothetical protein